MRDRGSEGVCAAECEVRPSWLPLRCTSGWSGRAVVFGPPATKGSVRAFVPKGGKHAIVINDNERGKSWQQELSLAMQETRPDRPVVGPVALSFTVYMQRPKGHYGTGRKARVLRASAPEWPTVKPDLDKVARAILDAGTGVWYRDDAQVVVQGPFCKVWADEGTPRVEVVAWELAVGGRLLDRGVSPECVRLGGHSHA